MQPFTTGNVLRLDAPELREVCVCRVNRLLQAGRQQEF